MVRSFEYEDNKASAGRDRVAAPWVTGFPPANSAKDKTCGFFFFEGLEEAAVAREGKSAEGSEASVVREGKAEEILLAFSMAASSSDSSAHAPGFAHADVAVAMIACSLPLSSC